MTAQQILIVEDERILAEDLEDTLWGLGYRVFGRLSSGEAAVATVASRGPIDLVLMDIHLEGQMDGISAAERIQSVYNIPVVYLTANEDAAVLARAKLSDAYGYMLKPYRTRALQGVIEFALGKFKTEEKLKARNRDLESALFQLHVLKGLLPLCSCCRQIRTTDGRWETPEIFIQNQLSAQFSHTICPDCARLHYPDYDIYNDDGGLIE